MSGDAGEAKQTAEAKELVFLKHLAKECSDYVLVTFFPKSQHLRDYRGGSADGTFNAVLDTLSSYFPSHYGIKKLVCLVADDASLIFGVTLGALMCMVELIDWDLPTIHSLNHRLEVAMKHSYMTGDLSERKFGRQ